jgi:gliding motility-associated-like protein
VLLNKFSAQKLLINEISQGISGNTEFIELLVNTSNPGQCPDENECVDIRGWIFDDNNGYFSNGVLTGTGVAQGAMRFSNDPMWSCMKPGSLILIYDVSTPNPAIPPQDLSSSDGNCNFVIPINSTLFERHETRPDPLGNNTYATTGWLAGGVWSLITMQNSDDSFQLRDPADLTVPVHAVSYGNNSFNNFIYFSGSAAGLSYQCVNTTSTSLFDQANWRSIAAASQSPGVYNSPENETMSNSINAICGDPFVATVNFVDDQCAVGCDGTADLVLSGGATPYGIPTWSTTETSMSIQNLCAGPYSITVSDNNGCDKTINFTINSIGTTTPTISASGPLTFCTGGSVILTSSSTVNNVWSTGETTQSITVTSSGSYTVTVTESGCATTSTATVVTVEAIPVVEAGPDINTCGAVAVVVNGSGANTYVWDNGVADGVAFIPSSNMTLTVTGTTMGGCVGTDQLTITVAPLTAFDLGSDVINCDGSSVTFNLPLDFEKYEWSDGSTGNSFTATSSGFYSVVAYNESESNIIQNGNFSGGTTASSNNFTTDYEEGIMGTFGLLTDAGTYAIAASPADVHFNFMNCGDHTSGTGNMLVVNGAGTANTAIWCQTVAVDPNTDYNFSCWAMNVINDVNVSDLQFFINGVQIGSIFSTSSNGCEWQQFNDIWNSGANTSAQLCIFNQNTTEAGNDMAIDDIFFAPICSIRDEINVVIETISVDAGLDQTICSGQSVQLNGTLNVPATSDEVTFSNSTILPIFDNFEISSDINVSGILSSATSLPLVSVCLDITHTWTGDLDISLECPNGTIIDLSSDNGGSGENYTATCFVPGAPAITSATAPFTGNYSPEQSFSLLDACPVNGTWTIIINDDGSGDIGTLNNWSITFENEVPDNNFTWSPLTAMINETTLTPTVNPTSTTTYTLSVTSPSGNCIATDDVLITISGEGDATFSYGQLGYCSSEPNPSPSIVTLGGTFSSSPLGIIFSDDIGTIDLINSTPGSYIITYSITGGCNASFDLPISIYAIPVVEAGVDQAICQGVQAVFNAAGAQTYSWDNGVIDGQAFSPSFGLGTVTFTVIGTDANGCQNSDQLNLTINSSPIIDGGPDQTVCLGADVILNATGASTLNWDNGVINGVIFNPFITQIYTVTGTDGNGCNASDQVLVTIGSTFTLDAGSDLSVCVGETVTLTATTIGQNIQWDNGVSDGVAFLPNSTTTYTVIADDGAGCSTSDQVVVSVNSPPNITLDPNFDICVNASSVSIGASPSGGIWSGEAISSNGFFTPSLALTIGSPISLSYTYTDGNGCSANQTMLVTVRPLPTINAGLDVNICPGATITLNASGGINYVWNNGVVNGVPFTPIDGIYSVTGTDIFGCSSSDQLAVSIGSFDIFEIDNQVICAGESITVTTGNATNYTWSPTLNLIQNGASATITPTQTTTYTVVGQNNACVDEISFEIEVKPTPVVTAGNDTLICAGQNLILQANANLGNIYWEQTIQNNTSYNPLQSEFLTVFAELDGCIGKDSLFVTVENQPQINLLNTFVEDCTPLTVKFEAVITGASNQTWTFGDGSISTNENPTHTYNSGGYANVTVSASSLNGCVNQVRYDSLIHAIAKPIAQFTSNLSELTYENGTVQFINSSTGAISYQWHLENDIFTNEIEPIHTFDISDGQNELVQLIAFSGVSCSDTAYLIIEVKEMEILYVPNSFTPNGDELNQSFKPIINSGVNPQHYTLQIYNRWGQLLFESKDYEIGWDGTFGNLGLVKSDIYTWKIVLRTTSEEQKIYTGNVNLIK